MSNQPESPLGKFPSHVPPPLLFSAATMLGYIFDRKIRKKARSGRLSKYAGWLVIDAGFAVGLWALITMKSEGQSPSPAEEKTALITGGPFQFSRNPIYLGAALSAIGRSIQASSPTSCLLAVVTMIYVDRKVIPSEELYLSEKFGESYDDYRSKVARWASQRSK